MLLEGKVTWLSRSVAKTLVRTLKGGSLLASVDASISGDAASAPATPGQPAKKRKGGLEALLARPAAGVSKGAEKKANPGQLGALLAALRKDKGNHGSDDEDEDEAVEDVDDDAMAIVKKQRAALEIHTKEPGKLYRDWAADVAYKHTRKWQLVPAA